MAQTISAANRRTYPRVPVKLSVDCLTDTERGPIHRPGSTTNVSASGVHFQTARWQGLRLGQPLLLRFGALSENGLAHNARTAKAWATIRRIELPPGGMDGFATAGIAAEFKEFPCTAVLNLPQ